MKEGEKIINLLLAIKENNAVQDGKKIVKKFKGQISLEKKSGKMKKVKKNNAALQSTKGRKTSQDGLLPPIKIIVSY